MRVGTNPFTLTTAYLANQKPYPNCNFGHICCYEWGYGKYVMWPSKELLDYIQLRNKGALVQTDGNKDQTALPLCFTPTSCTFWATFVLQSAGIVADTPINIG